MLAVLLLVVPVAHALSGTCGCCVPASVEKAAASCCEKAETEAPADHVAGHTCECSLHAPVVPVPTPDAVVSATKVRTVPAFVIALAAPTEILTPVLLHAAQFIANAPPSRQIILETSRFLS